MSDTNTINGINRENNIKIKLMTQWVNYIVKKNYLVPNLIIFFVWKLFIIIKLLINLTYESFFLVLYKLIYLLITIFCVVKAKVLILIYRSIQNTQPTVQESRGAEVFQHKKSISISLQHIIKYSVTSLSNTKAISFFDVASGRLLLSQVISLCFTQLSL